MSDRLVVLLSGATAGHLERSAPGDDPTFQRWSLGGQQGKLALTRLDGAWFEVRGHVQGRGVRQADHDLDTDDCLCPRRSSSPCRPPSLLGHLHRAESQA